jgi:hypothetical protein
VPVVDSEKPVIISGFTTPQVLEVCQNVSQMSVRASDNVGISTANMRIFNENNVMVYSTFMYKTAGTAQNGTWANDWTIPCSALIGKYQVNVQVLDAAGNASAWGAIPNFWVYPSTTQDKSNPAFVSGSVSPGPVTIGKTIPEVLVRLTDDTGIASVTFKLADPSGRIVSTTSAYRISGTKTDGVYRNDIATKTSYLPGRYTVHVDAVDEWQKISGTIRVGYIDLIPVPVVAPTPTPTPTPAPTAAAMKVTPYYSLSTSRSGALLSASSVILKAKRSGLFVASTLFASGQNSGLLSLGHLLEVTTNTPTICSVTGVQTWDRTGGIYTRATVNALSAGNCSVTWKFLGSTGRAPTSTTMLVRVSA